MKHMCKFMLLLYCFFPLCVQGWERGRDYRANNIGVFVCVCGVFIELSDLLPASAGMQ